MNINKFLQATLLVFITTTLVAQKKVVDFKSLLNEMINREQITLYPDAQYRILQFSSYDRRTTELNDSTWFANSDNNQFIRNEKRDGHTENVMMETNKPGAIVRFWITGINNNEGIVRIYLDGKKKPVVEMPIAEFVSKNSCGVPLSTSVASTTAYFRRGHNLYMPIPYAKSCKITYQAPKKGDNLYYCVNAREYTKKTKVVSFTANTVSQNKALLQKVNKVLSAKKTGITSGKIFNLSLPIAKEKSVAVNQSGKAISSFSLKIEGENLKNALRDIIVKITFDGKQTVWAPVGDFFGTGYELHPSMTYYSQVKEDGTMRVNWIMPYKNNCKITFENIGNYNYDLSGNLVLAPYKWQDNSMYFHSSWHQFTNIATGENKARAGSGGCEDLNFVTLSGRGVYVGDAITLFNTSLGGHWKSWWGEGDEKIYVDGDKFPTMIGTGSEDYYGYAWCEYAPFNHPYIAQPIGGGNFKFDMTVNMRFRGLDAIPFTKSLKFDMELWHWTKTKMNFAPITFYYLMDGATSNIKPDYAGAKAPLAFNRFDILNPEPENGLLEGENLKPTGKEDNLLGVYGDELSGGLALNWRNAQQGEQRSFIFYADKNSLLQKMALVSGKKAYFDIYLNGKKILSYKAKDDAKYPEIVNLQNIKLKRINTICIKAMGDGSNSFGIDYLRIEN